MPDTTFYFDLGSPYAWLTAARIDEILPGPVEWRPVLLGGLFRLSGRSSWALGDYRRRQRGMADIERRAGELGLGALRWPDPWPSDYLRAQRVVTWAFGLGDEPGRHLTRAAFDAAFTRGVDLSITAQLMEVVRDSGLDPAGAAAAIDDPAVKAALRAATDAAHTRGVFGVPTIAIGDELFWGDDRLEDARHAAHRAD